MFLGKRLGEANRRRSKLGEWLDRPARRKAADVVDRARSLRGAKLLFTRKSQHTPCCATVFAASEMCLILLSDMAQMRRFECSVILGDDQYCSQHIGNRRDGRGLVIGRA